MLKILQARLQQYMNKNFQMFKLDLEMAEEPEIKLPTSARCWNLADFIADHRKCKKNKKKEKKTIYFCFINYTEAFDCVNHNKLWKILKRWEYQSTLPASWEICMQVKRQQLELDMEQRACLKLGQEYDKAVYCHPLI